MSAKGLKVGAKYRLTTTSGEVVEGVLSYVKTTMFNDMILSVIINRETYGISHIESLQIVSE